MKTYVALLRGINVSGQKKIRMDDLTVHLKELGWKNIQTYIQSGNIVFNTGGGNPDQFAGEINQKLQEKYGFNVPTLVLESQELQYVIYNNPFTRDPLKDHSRLYVTFLFETPQPDLVNGLLASNQTAEQFHIEQKIIFGYYPEGYGRAVMNNNAFERRLKVEATTRNWKTVNELQELCNLD